MRIGQNTCFYIVSVFCLSYATGNLGIASRVTLTALLVGAAAAALLCPMWGQLADRVGFGKVMAFSLTAGAVAAFPLFLVLRTTQSALIIVFIAAVIAVANASNDAIQPGYFASLFGANIRYSGMSIGREGGTIIGAASRRSSRPGSSTSSAAGGPWPRGSSSPASPASSVSPSSAIRGPTTGPGSRRSRRVHGAPWPETVRTSTCRRLSVPTWIHHPELGCPRPSCSRRRRPCATSLRTAVSARSARRPRPRPSSGGRRPPGRAAAAHGPLSGSLPGRQRRTARSVRRSGRSR